MKNITEQLVEALREAGAFLNDAPIDELEAVERALERNAPLRQIVEALAAFGASKRAPAESCGDHTAEPWELREARPFPGALPLVHIRGAGGFLNVATLGSDDARTDDSANARRIVACVNACAGIPTAELEGAGFVKLDGDPLYELVRRA